MSWVAHWFLPIAVFWYVLFVQNKVQKNKESKAEPEKSSNTGDLESIRLRSVVWEHTRQQCSVLIGEHSPGPVSQQKAQRYSRKYLLSPLDIPFPKASALTLWKLQVLIFKYHHAFPEMVSILLGDQNIEENVINRKKKKLSNTKELTEKNKTENIRRQSYLFHRKRNTCKMVPNQQPGRLVELLKLCPGPGASAQPLWMSTGCLFGAAECSHPWVLCPELPAPEQALHKAPPP